MWNTFDMDSKSLYINHLRETLEKKEFFSTAVAIRAFCGRVLGYDQRRHHREEETIGATMMFGVNPKKTAQSKVKIERIVHGSDCYHFFNRSGNEYDYSGLFVQIEYSGFPLSSLAQVIGLKKTNLHVDNMKWAVYGKEWEGMEIPTKECLLERLDIKAPKLKPMPIEEIIKQYERRRNGSVAIPVK
jgi:hypothetical protein